MLALDKEWFTKEWLKVNIIEIPPHFWNWYNVEKIVK